MSWFDWGHRGQGRWDRVPLSERLVVFDLETTGLNPARDRPLAIGAVAVRDGAIDLDDSFHAELLPPDRLDPENVLVHRLTPQRLAEGDPSGAALERFLHFVSDAPLFAYHAEFDRAVLRKAVRRELGRRIDPLCLDVAHWVLNVEPDIGSKPPTLDVALGYFRIQAGARHDALQDALITARLVLVLLQRAATQGQCTVGALRRELAATDFLRRARS